MADAKMAQEVSSRLGGRGSHATAAPPTPFTYRSRLMIALRLPGYLLIVLFLVVAPVNVLVPESARVAVGVPVGVAFGSLVVWRIARIALVIGDQEIEIRNFWWTKRLSWSEVGVITGANAYFGIAVNFLYREQPGRVLIRGRASEATAWGGRRADKRQLLALLRELARKHQVDCKVDLRANHTFYTPEYWPESRRG